MGRSAFFHCTHYPHCRNNVSLMDKNLSDLRRHTISQLAGDDSNIRSLRRHGNTRRMRTSLLVIHLSSSHNDIPGTWLVS